LRDSYLGKKGDILTVGLGYLRQRVTTDIDTVVGVTGGEYALLPGYSVLWGYYGEYKALGLTKTLNVNGYTVDAFLEKKFGPAILNLEGAYVYFDNSHLAGKFDNGRLVGVKGEDSYYWYLQGQVLYDCKFGIGKPAIYAMYEYLNADRAYSDPSRGIYYKDYNYSRWGIGLNYYIKDNAVRLSLGLDHVDYGKGTEKYLETRRQWKDSMTDYFVQFQVMF